jgi:5-methylcytosine-specific restriction endonuclease McrA
MRKKVKKWKSPKAKRKLDRLFSSLILARDERTCQWCGKHGCDPTGKPYHFDNSHIIPREILVTRWNPENSVCLCFSCHKKRGTSWHGSPLEAVRWLRGYLGNARCEELLQASKVPFEFNQEAAASIEAALKERLTAIGHS